MQHRHLWGPGVSDGSEEPQSPWVFSGETCPCAFSQLLEVASIPPFLPTRWSLSHIFTLTSSPASLCHFWGLCNDVGHTQGARIVSASPGLEIDCTCAAPSADVK